MTGRGKHPDDDDALWQKVTSDVRAYDRAAELTSPAGPAVAKPEKKKNPKNQPLAAPTRLVGLAHATHEPPKPVDVAAGEHAGLDRASRRRLVQGDMDIAARLDLHGMTAAQAESRLRRFIDSAVLAQHRCVLIITGKGRDGQGVLRKLVPEWLKTPPLSARILAMAHATRADGGDGAMYVMLRRNRAAGQTFAGKHAEAKHSSANNIRDKHATDRPK